jgi:hypothetical protein
MVDAIERITRAEEILEEYVHEYNPRPMEDEPYGRVPVTIAGFESERERDFDYLIAKVETEWGEIVKSKTRADQFRNSWVACLCDEKGIGYSQFEQLEGERIWADVTSLDWKRNAKPSTKLVIEEGTMMSK